MGLLGKILLNEGITIFKCDILVKTAADQNKVEIYNEINKGGLLVAPAASALSKIKSDNNYYHSLKNSDVAILDSGFFCILLRIFKNIFIV